MGSETENQTIDEYVIRSKTLNGQLVTEREQWNTIATADAIRHFAYGIGDDNPLWIDREYSNRSRHGGLTAPPSFLTSVLYPGLHGFPMTVPLSSLISELSFEWYRTLYKDEVLQGSARQLDIREYRTRTELRLVNVLSQFTYINGRGEIVAKADSTMSRLQRASSELLVDRDTYRYTQDELHQIKIALRSETRTGNRKLSPAELEVGFKLPESVRGPLTIGDLIAWQSAIGPSYRASALGFRDAENAPHTAAIHPVTGWPYRNSQQHEDSFLSSQRGMPAPFDNAVMRFAWVSSVVTNWMGDSGFLRSLNVSAVEPILYGDTTWYRGEVIRSLKTDSYRIITVRINGTNQLNQLTTRGLAEILILPYVEVGRRTSMQIKASSTTDIESCSFAKVLAEHARRIPEKLAVTCRSHSLTYRELDQRSNLLSKFLKQRNIGPGKRVGVLLGRSLDSILAPVAILKTGASYVPLHNEHPGRALSRMTDEIQINMLLKHADQKINLPDRKIETVQLDRRWEDHVEETYVEENLEIKNSDIAYIMFTSGTTDKPKAVAITRGSLNSYLRSMTETLYISEDDVYLHTAPFSFSASIRQSLFPIFCGARIVVADEEQQRDQRALLNVIKEERITIWDTVPTSIHYCSELLRDLDTQERTRLLSNKLRLIMTTGESLPWALPYAWTNEFGQTSRFINLYSQTETSGTVCMFPVPVDITEKEGNVPIGKPLKNTTVHILDQSLVPVSPGKVGEIYVGGDRVALGYLNDPLKSGETFICDPFSTDVNARLCRTGDTARELPDGNLQVSGRSDTRIKFKGYRIEPTQIESELEKLDEIQRAAVVVHGDHLSHQRLVGYVVPKKGKAINASHLRKLLKSELPSYMIPITFVKMKEMPLNANAKLDRELLSKIDTSVQQKIRGHQITKTSRTEEKVMAICTRILRIESMMVDDNIFELGAHSLHVTQISSRILEDFGVHISFKHMFDHPTAKALSAFMLKNSKN
jgi:amino acid adenylation domain-containing protein